MRFSSCQRAQLNRSGKTVTKTAIVTPEGHNIRSFQIVDDSNGNVEGITTYSDSEDHNLNVGEYFFGNKSISLQRDNLIEGLEE
jgi:hypothetical protein